MPIIYRCCEAHRPQGGTGARAGVNGLWHHLREQVVVARTRELAPSEADVIAALWLGARAGDAS